MAMIEEWTDRGKRWRKVPAQYEAHYVLGLDLGQANDPTAIAVLHWQRIPLDEWKTKRSEYLNVNTQLVTNHFDVVHLERLRLEMSYPQIAAYVGELLDRVPLREGCDLCIDDTGVGRAVSDIFEKAGLHPHRICITAGNEVVKAGSRRWTVPKGVLVSNLDARLHCGELRFARSLTEAGALADELRNFQRSVTATGRSLFNARSGKHDDLVLAIAIATWWAVERHKHQIYTGFVRGLW